MLSPNFDNRPDQLYALRENGARVFPIGKSVEGRNILCVGFGNLQRVVLFCGGLRADEQAITDLLLRLCADLAEPAPRMSGIPRRPSDIASIPQLTPFGPVAGASPPLYADSRTDGALPDDSARRLLRDIDLARALSERGVLVLPCLNPDGQALYGAMDLGTNEEAGDRPKDKLRASAFPEKGKTAGRTTWLANARGVELSRNFTSKTTGKGIPGPSGYGGAYPLSEPESQSLCRTCRSFQVEKLLLFGAGNREIGWEYGEKTGRRADILSQLFASVSGYTRVSRSDPLGYTADWYVDCFSRPAFTVEPCEPQARGEELLPIYARLLEMLLLAMLV